MNLFVTLLEQIPGLALVLAACLLALVSLLLPMGRMRKLLFLAFATAAMTTGLLANVDMVLLAAIMLAVLAVWLVMVGRSVNK